MLPFDILHETPHWLAVNKPSGLNVEQLWDFPSVEADVKRYLQNKHTKEPFLGIVHRLDRPVSGVLLLAKRKQPLKILNEQFANKKVKKIYWAITAVEPKNEKGLLKHYLIKDQKQKRAFAFNEPKAKAILAQLEYKILKKIDNFFLLEVHPLSGKFHQIRVQLAKIGCPILGDLKYGSNHHFIENGIALHARSLRFKGINTDNHHKITASVPDHTVWKKC